MTDRNSPDADDWQGTRLEPIPVAQYLRMSTDHQQYSTTNQAKAIAAYAEAHGMEIVQTYADEGRSGLHIEGRDALKQLIDDVQTDSANFEAILVYDVSRWGRFQDADESAYYEYICRRHGFRVLYCAEQFDNNGSPIATIVKGVKRAMAAEFSRELSAKTLAGHCRLVELGYRQGGIPGYGLRRMLLDPNGNPKHMLETGQYKSLQSERVILVPGPKEEVETVRWIYGQFVDRGLNANQIAGLLNERQIKPAQGRSWWRSNVWHVLTNEKYIGNNVYNRTSYKLLRRFVKNSPDQWIRADGAFEPIVPAELFYRARGIIEERNRRFSDDDLLCQLRALLDRHGSLSCVIIDEADGPPATVYRYRFGGLLRAYTLIGYKPDVDFSYIEINRRLRLMHPEVVRDTIERIEGLGGTVCQVSMAEQKGTTSAV